MVRNRLTELQENSKYVDANNVEDGATAVEMEPLKASSRDLRKSTADFFATFDENVVSNIDKVKANVEEIKNLQRKILTSVKNDEKETAENRMNDLVEENKRMSRTIQVYQKGLNQNSCVIMWSPYFCLLSLLARDGIRIVYFLIIIIG